MIHQVAIKSLPQEWLWCETWCSTSELSSAKTIDLVSGTGPHCRPSPGHSQGRYEGHFQGHYQGSFQDHLAVSLCRRCYFNFAFIPHNYVFIFYLLRWTGWIFHCN